VSPEETNKTREPMSITEEQSDYCTNTEQTCCTDDEFVQIYENVEENVRKIKNLGMMMGQVITNIGAMLDEDFQEMFQGINTSSIQEYFDVSKLKEKVSHIKEYWSMHHEYVLKGIRYILRSGSGIACGMCVPENHNSFIGLESSFQTQMIINKNECFNMLRDEDLKIYSNFLTDVITVYRLSFILNDKFNAEHYFDLGYLKDQNFNGVYELHKKSCTEEDYFTNNKVECLQFCIELGIMNQNPLAGFLDKIATNFAFIQDYSTDREYLLDKQEMAKGGKENIIKKVKEEVAQVNSEGRQTVSNDPAKEEEEDTFDDFFLRMRDMGDTDFYLTPMDKVEVNLNHITVQMSKDNGGWQNFKYGAYLFVQKMQPIFAVRFGALLTMLMLFWIK
jgi:hypothetical protein